MASKEFEDMLIPEWKLSASTGEAKIYRVFKNEDEFETIEAENASDAISKCGTQDVFMIKFGGVDDGGIIDQGLLAKIEVEKVEVAAEEAVTEVAAEEAPAQPA